MTRALFEKTAEGPIDRVDLARVIGEMANPREDGLRGGSKWNGVERLLTGKVERSVATLTLGAKLLGLKSALERSEPFALLHAELLAGELRSDTGL